MDEKVVELDVKYELGHSYHEKWTPTLYHCPNCGHKETWVREGGGDYYLGETYLCWHCGAAFYLPDGTKTNHERDWQTRQRLEAIRSAVSSKEQGNGNAGR